ncbi:MAG: hypothetical protein GY888_04680, partial [Planctomycetaceae bacterium]|nr:hypothetical protein [Planctomycetaceae bacterium]
EINTSRYSIVSGFFRWNQAREDAIARKGSLATFASEAEWLGTLDALGEGALDSYTGLWIGATDSEEEATWKWITGEDFDFNNWANGQPDNGAGADHAEVSGGFGPAPGKWFDTPAQAIRDGYILESTTDPNDPDTDGDGLSDGYEAGIDRFSTVSGFFRWEQARLDAIARGGTLATFTTEQEWQSSLDLLGEDALNEFSGLWIGATDSEEEGNWKWITGEAFDFNNWANGQPDNVGGADHAEVSGGFGPALGFWFDTPGQAIRDGYILEKGIPTDPSNPDTDGDGFSDGQEVAAGSNP